MRIVTANVNGVRSAATKGFFRWLARQNADFVCLQETKAQAAQLTDPGFWPKAYHVHYYDAERKGYSGVAVFAKHKPDEVIRGFGVPEFDGEGRYLEARYGQLSVVSLYLPSGSAGPERQASKFRFLDVFMRHLAQLRRAGRDYILCGDWNIAHRAIDLRNWKSNQKNSGFLPEERAWFDQLVGPAGYVDAFREVNQKPDQYTWWSNRGAAYAKNVGWRIDYQIASDSLRGRVLRSSIYKDRRFSDHAPLIVDYDYSLSSGLPGGRAPA
jgi:exodeoxyribonuclease III